MVVGVVGPTFSRVSGVVLVVEVLEWPLPHRAVNACSNRRTGLIDAATLSGYRRQQRTLPNQCGAARNGVPGEAARSGSVGGI